MAKKKRKKAFVDWENMNPTLSKKVGKIRFAKDMSQVIEEAMHRADVRVYYNVNE